MNQNQLLGHVNMIGANIPATAEFQQMQMKFWTDVYVSSIRAGNSPYTAGIWADTALGDYNRRFMPNGM